MLTELLFSYGTLRQENVQLETFGRKMEGKNDVLKGFKLHHIQITDPKVHATSGPKFHPIAIETKKKSDQIEGILFKVSPKELEQAYLYEVADYERVQCRFQSGNKGWIYISAKTQNQL